MSDSVLHRTSRPRRPRTTSRAGRQVATDRADAPPGPFWIRHRLPGRPDEAFAITAARPSATADRKIRRRRYLLSQTGRLCCFVAAVALPLPLLYRMGLVAASMALPWCAVVAANAGPTRTRRSRRDAIITSHPTRTALPPTSRGI